jgi:hypothetical protein
VFVRSVQSTSLALETAHSLRQEERELGISVPLIRLCFFSLLVLIRLLSSSVFASGNDRGGPPGMDLLLAGRWRRVERGHDHLAHGLPCTLWRLILLVAFLIDHLEYPLLHSTARNSSFQHRQELSNE